MYMSLNLERVIRMSSTGYQRYGLLGLLPANHPHATSWALSKPPLSSSILWKELGLPIRSSYKCNITWAISIWDVAVNQGYSRDTTVGVHEHNETCPCIRSKTVIHALHLHSVIIRMNIKRAISIKGLSGQGYQGYQRHTKHISLKGYPGLSRVIRAIGVIRVTEAPMTISTMSSPSRSPMPAAADLDISSVSRVSRVYLWVLFKRGILGLFGIFERDNYTCIYAYIIPEHVGIRNAGGEVTNGIRDLPNVLHHPVHLGLS